MRFPLKSLFLSTSVDVNSLPRHAPMYCELNSLKIAVCLRRFQLLWPVTQVPQ